MEASMTRPPGSTAGGIAVGDCGEVLSTLRPTGNVKFDDCIVDCVAEGDFLEKGRKVKITEIHGNRVVVGRADDEK
jgi:membrane-bound serine protease (ClpP class)